MGGPNGVAAVRRRGFKLTLWVNGQEVGYSQDSRLPAEFDITAMSSRARTGWRCR